MPVQQLIDGARSAATRTIQPGQLMKLADRIKSVRAGIEEIQHRACAENGRAQHCPGEEFQPEATVKFLAERFAIWRATFGSETMKFQLK